MKQGIHPEYVETQVTCTCGNSFTTHSTARGGVIRAEVCAACHPFYTGKQKILDTGGRVARFESATRTSRRASSFNAAPGWGSTRARRFVVNGQRRGPGVRSRTVAA